MAGRRRMKGEKLWLVGVTVVRNGMFDGDGNYTEG